MLNYYSWIIYVIILLYLSEYLFANRNVEYRWGQWSQTPLTCSVTCGKGVRCRVRNCIDGYGIVQPSTSMCQNTELSKSEAEECIPCVVNIRCPRVPGWGTWTPWSSCSPIEDNQEIDRQGCRSGSRSRYRLCNNPPPEPPPYGLNCSGINQQIAQCSYDCFGRVDSAPDNIANKITYQVELDQLDFYIFHNILRKHENQKVRMDCATPAYNLAKRLSVRGIISATKRALTGSGLTIRWLKNGRPLNLDTADSKRKSKASITKLKRMHDNEKMNRLANEEIRWNSLLDTSSSIHMEDTYLVFSSIKQGDQGVYTCQISMGKYKWNLIFYTLIVTGIKYIALEADPFYLHSNLGVINALSNMAVWMESAQIVWKLNGHEYSRGLAIRLDRRVQLIKYLNLSHHGTWRCYLHIPAAGLPSRVGNPWSSMSRIYLINEFYLNVNPTNTLLWQIGEHPITVKILRQTALTLLLIGLFLILIIFLSIWAARRWMTRSLTNDQQKAIIQEIIDNECRLLLTCKKRANMNKRKLLPLILLESQRLQKASKFLGVLLRRKTGKFGNRRLTRRGTHKISTPSKMSRVSRFSKFISFGDKTN
ncbi:unnamed protein product [Trichobilharzia szidati]|nr:unnamed protein product [Trichobilharzia szidati]